MCCPAAGSPSGSGSAGCRRSTPPPACRSSGGARGWTSTCAAWRRCGRRTRSSSPASSTRCRARTWARRPCSDHTRRCCSAARLRRHCAAPGGSPRAGSAAAGRTSPGSARASRRCATARARLGATRRPRGSSCVASSTSSTTTPAGSAGHSRERASRCSTTSLHCARRASPRSSSTSTSRPGSAYVELWHSIRERVLDAFAPANCKPYQSAGQLTKAYSACRAAAYQRPLSPPPRSPPPRYAASTFGMISSLRRLRSSSVLETGTSVNGGQSRGIVSPTSL